MKKLIKRILVPIMFFAWFLTWGVLFLLSILSWPLYWLFFGRNIWSDSDRIMTKWETHIIELKEDGDF